MSAVVVRCISSFEHGVVFYIPIRLEAEDTLASISKRVAAHVHTEPKYKPLRSRIDTFDTFKLYVQPGQPKPPNLVIADEGEEFTSENWGRLEDLGIKPEAEISFFCGAAYAQYKVTRT